MAIHEGDSLLDGKYHIQKLVGTGAFSRVWLAEEPKFGRRRVAIKEPRDDRINDEERQELQQRFRQEIELASQVEEAHVPNVIRVHTLESLPDDTELLVMEYAQGGSVADLVAEQPDGLPIEQSVQITQDVLEALKAFHELPSTPIHRDIKPENILLDGEGRARLCDLGLAQLPGSSGRTNLTAGRHPGTPMYMPPEQESSPASLTEAADIFSLGCVLFEMLTGVKYKRREPGTKASSLRPEVPAWLDQVLSRALAPNQWDRYQDAAEMTAELELQGEQSETQVEGPLRTRTVIRITAIALFLLALGAMGWFVLRPLVLPDVVSCES